MNRKQRNNLKREAFTDWWIDGISLFAIDHRPNRARHESKLRHVYHGHADWLCSSNADRGYVACDRCHWQSKCKAMRTNSHPRIW